MLLFKQNNPLRGPDDIANMIEFDLIRSSLPLELVANDALLANSANWKPANTRDINIGISEVELVC